MLPDSERNEMRDMSNKLEVHELSTALCENSSVASYAVVRKESLLQEEMFFSEQTTSGRLHLAKELLKLPPNALKSFAGSKGLTKLNSRILVSFFSSKLPIHNRIMQLLLHSSLWLLHSTSGRVCWQKMQHNCCDIVCACFCLFRPIC
jgi:hypothetical protein